jgi:hypothetical protein
VQAGLLAMIWRILHIAAAIVCLGSFIAAVGLSYQYVNTRSTTPDVTSGRVFAHNVHGQVSYLNAREKWNLNLLFIISGAAFAGAMGIQMWKRPF